MNRYYPNLIESNPAVPFRVHGFASDHWCNYFMLTNASIAEFQISVYANTADDARFYADRLKVYIEQNPMLNNYINHPDDISIGIRQPVIDQLSSAYKVDMVLMTGALTI